MPRLLPISQSTEVFYPSSDGEPLAETYVHLYALLVTLEVLRQYLRLSASNSSGRPIFLLCPRVSQITSSSRCNGDI